MLPSSPTIPLFKERGMKPRPNSAATIPRFFSLDWFATHFPSAVILNSRISTIYRQRDAMMAYREDMDAFRKINVCIRKKAIKRVISKRCKFPFPFFFLRTNSRKCVTIDLDPVQQFYFVLTIRLTTWKKKLYVPIYGTRQREIQLCEHRVSHRFVSILFSFSKEERFFWSNFKRGLSY